MDGGFHVNLHGERFADETLGFSEHAHEVLEQPERVAFVIYDEQINQLSMPHAGHQRFVKRGIPKVAETIEDLARQLGLDPVKLSATVDEYRTARASGRDRFGRTTFADLQPPYYGVRVTGALFHTQGGLKVDFSGRVLRQDGEPVPNLYAGGGVAAGVSGHGPGGYLGGNGLLTAVGYGYLTGRHAGQFARGGHGDP
jgi:fumarate reductase flavoprotein subunit